MVFYGTSPGGLSFYRKWNGTAPFISPFWIRADSLDLYTDASATLGFGAFFAGEWFNGKWPQWLLDEKHCIEYLEMVPVYLSRRRVVRETVSVNALFFHSDNLGVVQAWENLKVRQPFRVLDLMRRLVMVAATKNLAVTIKHIRGLDNHVADALSRFQMERFRRCAPFAEKFPTPTPSLEPLRKTFL